MSAETKLNLIDAIKKFKSELNDSSYVRLGAKGNYITVGYRINHVRNFFGERLSIQTESIELSNGSHKFKAYIYLDDRLISTGESKQMKNADKEFEKQNTVSIGRALSFLGFMGDEIATAEEMEQFLQTNKQKPSTESSNVNLESEDSDSKVNEIIQDIEKCKSSSNPHVLETNLEQIHSRNKDFLLQLQIEDPESFHMIEEKEKTLQQQMRSK